MTETHATEDEVDGWQTWRQYKVEALMEGKSLPEAVRQWEAAASDPDVEARWVRNQ